MSENPSSALNAQQTEKKSYESDIAIVNRTIEKIAYLLVLGFGDAGDLLLSKILFATKKSSEFDFTSEANNIYGIYGFCDIRNFTDATEVLREEVLKFVNSIAEIVHEEVSNAKGGANKNIGDAFLVVWKLKKNKDLEKLITLRDENEISNLYNQYDNL